MKIKTVVDNVADKFDARVNTAMEEGYTLTRRISDVPGPFIAELVMFDPVEPEPVEQADHVELGPWDAVRAIWNFCNSVSPDDCNRDKCPLCGWCGHVLSKDPTEWELPEEGPQA